MKTNKLTVALLLISCLIHSSTSNAQTNNSTQIQTETARRFVPPPLPDRGLPTGRRKGAASRTGQGLCPSKVSNLTALVPEIDKNKPWGLTFAEHPTFWVSIPELSTEVGLAEFVLQDERDRDIYRTMFFVPNTSGIIRIDLPNLPQYSLKSDQNYLWTFKIICNPQQSDYYISVDGIVKRIARNNSKIDSVWYDILTDLASRRLADPEDTELKEQWAQLMRQIDLEELAQKPILPCCEQN